MTATAWISAFNRAVAARDGDALGPLFAPDSHWRNICGIGWAFATVSGGDGVRASLMSESVDAGAQDFELDAERHPPRRNTVAGVDVVEAVLKFRTA